MSSLAFDESAQRERPQAVGEYSLAAKVLHWLTAILVFFMVGSGVIAKQLGDGAVSETLFHFHKLTGVTVLAVVALRLVYRLVYAIPRLPARRATSLLHWSLYGVILLVPLLGWAAVSDNDDLGIVLGFSLPAIWPQGAGFDGLLLHAHAYAAFGFLAIVALHIGIAMHDYMGSE